MIDRIAETMTALQTRALGLLRREPNRQASSSRIGRLLGYAKGCHGPGGAVMRALEKRGFVVQFQMSMWAVKK